METVLLYCFYEQENPQTQPSATNKPPKTRERISTALIRSRVLFYSLTSPARFPDPPPKPLPDGDRNGDGRVYFAVSDWQCQDVAKNFPVLIEENLVLT